MSMEILHAMNGRRCSCGKIHRFDTRIISGMGVLCRIPEEARRFGAKKVFMLSDPNTWDAAGKTVWDCLEDAGIGCVSYILPWSKPEPEEKTVGSVFMHFEADCDLIIGVGSGVINDIGKILSAVSSKPYIIVATAPSMDGYASGSSSMERDGLKISLASRAPDVILGDSQVLCSAPKKLMQAGLGDMLAKYISICEWRIAQLIVGEYYCPEIASLVRTALKRCTDNGQKLFQGDREAVMAVFEGLVITGIAMNYAGLSRPASGVEHYISHILDMRGASLHTPVELHGLQCAVGTLIAARLYEKLSTVVPDREKAAAFVTAFNREQWNGQLRQLLAQGAENMIAKEDREGKYNKSTHPARLETIVRHWDDILAIIAEEVPPAARLEALLDTIEAPKCLSDMGTDEGLLPLIFAATKDIRDKYVLSRLCWDLGILEEIVK